MARKGHTRTRKRKAKKEYRVGNGTHPLYIQQHNRYDH